MRRGSGRRTACDAGLSREDLKNALQLFKWSALRHKPPLSQYQKGGGMTIGSSGMFTETVTVNWCCSLSETSYLDRRSVVLM